MKENFKDLFSTQALDYSKFRPTYPKELFRHLASITRNHRLAWDCGTGNGQAAQELAHFFTQVVATDPSEKQLSQAQKNPKIEFRLGGSEASDLATESVDLITVAQAFHWFDQEKFFAEARRVLVPGGALAIWCYELAVITPEVDASVMKLYDGVLGGYWEPQRKLVEEGYANVALPFQEMTVPKFQMHAQWSFEHLIGYLKTWSALQTYMKKNGNDPLKGMVDELAAAWGDLKETKPVMWNIGIKIGVKK